LFDLLSHHSLPKVLKHIKSLLKLCTVVKSLPSLDFLSVNNDM